MEPFFFGPEDRRLFGVYHAPARATAQDCGVVFCQPLAHEFYNAHRCSTQLAAGLSDAGLGVLRFDYYGTGESAGEYEEATVAQWLDDIGLAAEELRRRGCRRLCLAGLRFGATLAAMFSAERGTADALVLWEPVANGADYLRELMDLHRQMLADAPVQGDDGEHELLGFEFGDGLRREMAGIDLRTNQRKVGRGVLLIEGIGGSLRTALEATAGRVDYEATPVSRFWLECPGNTILPGLPQRMASWISSACR